MEINTINTNYDELMISFLNGNEKSFYIIAKEWKDPVINYFYNHLNNFDASEELTQEVFISLWKIKKYNAKGTFSSFIYRIARNKLIDFYRKRKTLFESIDEVPGWIDKNYSIDSDFDEKLILEEEQKLIKKTMNQISEDDKNIIVLSQFHSLKYQEIADIMNCSVNSVKGKVFRAIRKFADKYKEIEGYVTKG